MGDRQWTTVNGSETLSIPSVLEAKVTDCGKMGSHLWLKVGELKIEQVYDDNETAKQKAIEKSAGFLGLALRQIQGVLKRGG